MGTRPLMQHIRPQTTPLGRAEEPLAISDERGATCRRAENAPFVSAGQSPVFGTRDKQKDRSCLRSCAFRQSRPRITA